MNIETHEIVATITRTLTNTYSWKDQSEKKHEFIDLASAKKFVATTLRLNVMEEKKV